MEQLLQLAPGPHWMAMAVIAWWVMWIVVHVGFAVAVGRHAGGRATAFVPAWLWTVGTLFCGPLVGIGYWYFHASSNGKLASRRDRLSGDAQ